MSTTELADEIEALKAKYRIERDKRLRSDGNDQYIEVTGEFARFTEDPYVEPFDREPLTDEVDVVVVGGGFGGLMMGARLRQAGVERIRVIEKGGDFGGTWYWNRYPGAMCDIESYIYLPLLEDVGYMPTEKYVQAPEILAYCQMMGRHFDLYDLACFQTEVTGCRWDESSSRWVISTNRSDAIRAQHLVMANGPLHRPKLPGIPGIEDFKGHSFHTSRWDYDYTGGTNAGGLTGLRDKRVGVIGTGATGVQVVPAVARDAEHLYVFQRTPSSIDVRGNRPTDWEWAGSLEPGWQQRRMDNFNNLVSGKWEPEDLVGDGWTDIIGRYVELFRKQKEEGQDPAPGQPSVLELADFEKMNELRARIESIVEDSGTAEALKPWYRQFCKRPCFHDEYLQAFNNPNVTLVDTDGKGVERVTETGVVVDGVEYPVDCLIFATGFEVGTGYVRRSGYDLVGRDGVALTEHWANGARTLHGIHTRGFPNCFIISHIQSANSPNFPHMLSHQSTHIAYIISEAAARGADVVEVSAEAEEFWVSECIRLARGGNGGPGYQDQCTPGYYNNEGQRTENGPVDGYYGGGVLGLIKVLTDWREAGELEGLELTTNQTVPAES